MRKPASDWTTPFPVLLRFGSQARRIKRGLAVAAGVTVLGAALASMAAAQPAPDHVKVDMGSWFRRDWDECESATKIKHAGTTLRITSEQSTGLFWQIPTINGTALPLDPEAHPWLDDCKRPPRSFNSEIQEQGLDEFLDVTEYPYVTWRWKVDYAVTREQKVKPGQRLKKKYDDFPAKIGISILKKGSSSIREVAYVWSGSLPDDLMFKSETTIIPYVWKLEWRRFVAQSGLDRTGEWISETRNLLEDYRRGYPGEEPGKILRVYLMTDSDNTQGRAATWYGDLTFHRENPNR
jgi:hypothetical protein